MFSRKAGFLILIALLMIAPFMASTQTSVKAQDGNTLTIAGLQAPVTVYYDEFGIPHIYADNTHDLFFAQAYIHSTDRFWQMEWWRLYSAGRQAEIGGPSYAGFDMFIRTLDFTGAAERDLSVMSPDALIILEAYNEGVNAYIDSRSPAEAALEFEILAEQGVEWDIAPWTLNDTLRWFKMMALDLSGNFQTELLRDGITQAVGSLGANFLLPAYPFDVLPVIVEPGGVDYTEAVEVSHLIPEDADFSQLAQALISSDMIQSQLEITFGANRELGSNSWVIGPDNTDSGMTYLANDPHLGILNPSIWYEVGLHCNEVSADCPYDVVGVSFAGAPGVIIGHNARVAWGFTNVGTDVQDLYTLTINPDNPLQYQLDGEWVDFEANTQTVHIAGADSVELPILNSVWGPVISSVIGFDVPYALRWTALDANTLVDAIIHINTAQNWEEFRAAATLFDVPAQNMLYADVDGNIGYQTPGKTPIRAAGHSGKLPVDGSLSSNAWEGYIPFEEMPSLYNPEIGYIVTANNSVVNKDYPYYLTDDWDYGYRAARIEIMIQNDEDGVLSVEDIQTMHRDNYNLKADYLIAALENLSFEDSTVSDLVAWLSAWDRQNNADSGEALLLEAYWSVLLEKIFIDDLGFVPGGGSHYWYLVSQMVASPEHVIYGTLWDDKATADAKESANEIMSAAFVEAVAWVQELHGTDQSQWAWGDEHIATFEHELFGTDPELAELFNVETPVGGGSSIVNATGWSAANPFRVGTVPSMRQILIPQAWDSSMRTNTFGQSGNPNSPHYSDQMEMWATGEYHADLFSREAVEAAAVSVWELLPN